MVSGRGLLTFGRQTVRDRPLLELLSEYESLLSLTSLGRSLQAES